MTYQHILEKYKDNPEDLTLVRMPDVEIASGLKRSAIYKRIADGTFPAPIKITSRCSAWIKGEINEWIAKRIDGTRNQSEVA